MGNLISFLKSYGPWAGNELQYEEHVRKEGLKHNMRPLEYLSPYTADIENIQEILTQGNSKLIFLSGNAGDGKTHFLGRIFEDPTMLNLSTDNLQDLLETPSSFKIFENVLGFNFSTVSDLTQLPEGSAEEEWLFAHILLVLGEYCSVPTSSLVSESPLDSQDLAPEDNDSEKLQYDMFADNSLPNLVIVAGNNGRILEEIKRLLMQLRSFLDESRDSSDAEALVFGPIMASKSMFVALEQRLSSLEDRLMFSFIHQSTFTDPAVTVFDMSNRIDDALLAEIFEAILNHEGWSGCQDCTCAKACPILRNRQLLSQPWLIQRIQHIFFILRASSACISIRRVQLLIVNALLGLGFEADSKSNYLSCRKVKYNVNANQGQCTLYSNVYDNLMGLNFKPEQRKGLPIFMTMGSWALGGYSTKQIDDFLLNDHPSYHDLRQAFLAKFDLFELENKLSENLEQIKLHLNDETKGKSNKEQLAIRQEFNQRRQSLRRLLFFTLGAPLDNESEPLGELIVPIKVDDSVDYDYTSQLFFNPYVLTAYPNAREFIFLCKLLKAEVFDKVAVSDVAHNLILGLNRLYTGLHTLKDTDLLFITADHINHSNFLYRESIFKVPANTYSSSHSVNLRLLPERDYVPVLQFEDSKSAMLTLTPSIFECIMRLSQGESTVTLSKRAINRLLNFRANVFSILNRREGGLVGSNNISSLSLINSLDIVDSGNIVSSDTI